MPPQANSVKVFCPLPGSINSNSFFGKSRENSWSVSVDILMSYTITNLQNRGGPLVTRSKVKIASVWVAMVYKIDSKVLKPGGGCIRQGK
jgi:NADPH-dependent 7-cyano-7-deazaguanine reductase QueF-like protein